MLACYGDGFFIPYFSANGLIRQLQIRYDNEYLRKSCNGDTKKMKQKRYRWFSSSDQPNGTPATNCPTFGLPVASSYNHDTVFVTEGGLKAYTATALNKKKRTFVAIPGVSCFKAWEEMLDELKIKGVNTVVDAFDSDREYNPSVKNAIDKLYKIAEKRGFDVRRCQWDIKYKGVDDYLLAVKNGEIKPSQLKRKNISLLIPLIGRGA